MEKIRDRNNYPDIQIAPFQESKTKAIFPAAVYTNGSVNISSRKKQISYEVDVYASIDAFEAGGEPIATPSEMCRIITNETVPTYDEVIMANAQVVGAVLVVLQSVEAQYQAAQAAE